MILLIAIVLGALVGAAASGEARRARRRAVRLADRALAAPATRDRGPAQACRRAGARPAARRDARAERAPTEPAPRVDRHARARQPRWHASRRVAPIAESRIAPTALPPRHRGRRDRRRRARRRAAAARRDRAEDRRRRRSRRAAARPPRADPALAVRRQHDRQGRHRHPLRRPRLPRQVRERARPPADRSIAWPRSAPPPSSCSASAGACALSRPDYAQVLQGGAVAVLYLTLFAAFRFYDVIGAMPAFVLMVAVAALAAALAVLQDARALAVVGALGGFATPLIVSTGSDNYVALFTYYFVLDLGIAAVAWSKTWRLAQPDRLRRHLHRRDGVGRAQVPARGLRHQPGVPDRLLPALRRHPGPAGAPARARRAGRRRGCAAAATRGSTAACCSACRR